MRGEPPLRGLLKDRKEVRSELGDGRHLGRSLAPSVAPRDPRSGHARSRALWEMTRAVWAQWRSWAQPEMKAMKKDGRRRS